jgi:serine/threonine-protein kinase
MTLGRYVVERQAGAGGMGVVFRALQRGAHGFERDVAVKTIHPSLVADETHRRRLIDEARIAAAIRHENVVQVLDVCDEDGLLFVVLEWIDGITVRSLLREREQSDGARGLPLPIAARIVADMLEGLHHAHELTDAEGRPRELVHRDVSPDNAIIARGGTTKLIDFGLARVRDRAASITESGVVLGKVSYMAPEQARGEKLDRRADIWAMGVVLRLCATGKIAHSAPSDLQRLYMLTVGQEPDALPDDAPEWLRPILERALAVEPAQRFATCAEFRAALLEKAPRVATREDVAAFIADPMRARSAAIEAQKAQPAEASVTVTSATKVQDDASLRGVSTREGAPEPAPRRGILPLGAAIAATAVLASLVTVALTRSTPPAPAAHVEAIAAPAAAPPPPPPSAAPMPSPAAPAVSTAPVASARVRPPPAKPGRPAPSARDYGF